MKNCYSVCFKELEVTPLKLTSLWRPKVGTRQLRSGMVQQKPLHGSCLLYLSLIGMGMGFGMGGGGGGAY